MSKPVFNGTRDQQELANEIFQMMKFQGKFFATDAPIKQSLRNLADFLSAQRNVESREIEKQIDSALRQNEAFFTREEVDGDVVYIISRTGKYRPIQRDTSHSFKERLYQPEKPLPVDDIRVVVSTSRPVLTSVEPVFISDYWQEQAESVFTSSDKGPISEDEDFLLLPQEIAISEQGELLYQYDDEDDDDEAEVQPIQEMGSEEEIQQHESSYDFTGIYQDLGMLFNSEAHASSEHEADVAEDEQYAEHVALSEQSEESQELDEEPERDVVENIPEKCNPATTIYLQNSIAIDLSKSNEELLAKHRDVLERVLIEKIDQDPLRRIVHFGRSIYPEASIVGLGKNDLRRIRDYIVEVGEPLLDTAIIADLYYHNPRHSDYEGLRFSLNYRLSREKDFEFVGVEGAYLWSTKGLPVMQSKRVKASEMGHLTAYLTEDYDDSLESQSLDTILQTGSVNRLLTFFEWEYGILPFDQSLAALLPKPMLSDQRSAVLRIESPQHYTNFLIEVRYPTGSRGGWIQGLEGYFHEHLVAGALITLSRTDEPNVFTITYEESAMKHDRLLTLDDKKNRLSFADVSYDCVVDENQLISQKTFGKAKNLKSLPMNERRKADVVLNHVFEIMGERVGRRDKPIYRMTIEELCIAYNILRPASISYLRSLLEGEEDYRPVDSIPGTYEYEPKPEPAKEQVMEEDDDVQIPLVGGRRWTYGDDD